MAPWPLLLATFVLPGASARTQGTLSDAYRDGISGPSIAKPPNVAESPAYPWVAAATFTEEQGRSVVRLKDRLKKADLQVDAEKLGFDLVVNKDGGALLLPKLAPIRSYTEGLRQLGAFALERRLTAKDPDGSARFARIGDFPEGMREMLLRDMSFAGNAVLDMDQKVTAEGGLDITMTGTDGKTIRLPLTLGDRGAGVGSPPGYEAQAVPYRRLSNEAADAMIKGGPAGPPPLLSPFYMGFATVSLTAWGSPLNVERDRATALRALTAEISRRVDENDRLLAEARAGLAELFAQGDPETAGIIAAKGKSTDELPPALAYQIDGFARDAKRYGFDSPEAFRAFVKGAKVSDLSMGLGFMTAVRAPNGLRIFGHEY